MKTHHYLLAMLFGVTALLQGCGNEDMPTPDVTGGSSTASLNIACISRGTISRAEEPTHEFGLDGENAIDDAVVVIYDTPVNVNEAEASKGKVVAVLNFDLTNHPSDKVTTNKTGTATTQSLSYYQLGNANAQTISSSNAIVAKTYSDITSDALVNAIAALDKNKDYYAMAFCNLEAAKITDIVPGMKVSALRDFVYTGTIYTGSGNMNNKTHFAMTAINEVCFRNTFDERGSTVNIPTMMVQRLAARIDVAFGNSAPAGNNRSIWTDDEGNAITFSDGKASKYTYDVCVDAYNNFRFPLYDEGYYQAHKDEANYEDRRIDQMEYQIKSITLVNAVTAGTYLIEHSSGTPKYLGNEGAWSGGFPTNFVQSCTSVKPSGSNAYRKIETLSLTSSTVSPFDVIAGGLQTPGGSGKFATYAILGYVCENTFRELDDILNEDQEPIYRTALKLDGTVTPANNFSGSATGNSSPVSVSITLRHSFNTPNIKNPLCYAVVRNTIYRVYIKFYAEKEKLIVREYWYNGRDNAWVEEEYSANFKDLISTGSGPSHD